MTGIDSREADHQQIFRDIGGLLAAHRLFPAPTNYALFFHVINDPDGAAARAVDALICDGLRLSQADADRIRAECGIEAGGPPVPALESLAQARRQIDDFASIVEATREETRSYGVDLARGADELNRMVQDSPLVAQVVRITGDMIERTRTTEAQLEVAREEASALRTRLAEAEDEARRDPLTRLPNRRAFEDRLAEMLDAGGLASIAICDIDRFKTINDTHGHAVGDRVLRMFADVLNECCGDHMVARIGGEEFVVLFEGLGPDAAGALLDEAREDLASRQFRVRGTDQQLGRITFSAGVAYCVVAYDLPPLKRADDLLYKAKNGGRNQVIVEAA